MKQLDPFHYKREITLGSKSVTYWARPGDQIFFTNEDLTAFENEMRHLHCNGRVCLHADPSAMLHDMIIFEWAEHIFPPHRHLTKAETITPIVNKVLISIFNSPGSTSTYGLTENATFTIPAATYHQITALKPYAIYREIKLGPFMGATDREFLPHKWSR